jgi:murein L,D-transpeptidase YafK
LICIKEERKLELWINGAMAKTYPMTAFSGGPGPKLREGDRQIPEGIYPAVHLNPNSAFHLSVKVGYPNAWDKAWAKEEKRERLGGDIFIHGEDVTIGCIPIGNRAIEEVFWAVYQAKPAHTRILISPVDFRKPGKGLPAGGGRMLELYRKLKAELARFAPGREPEKR